MSALLDASKSEGLPDILQEPLLGRIQPGREADLLVVDGDPLRDIQVLARDGQNLDVIMKAGRFYKRSGV